MEISWTMEKIKSTLNSHCDEALEENNNDSNLNHEDENDPSDENIERCVSLGYN